MSWRDRGPAVRATVKLLWFFCVVATGSAAALTVATAIAWFHSLWPVATGWTLVGLVVTAILGIIWTQVYEHELQDDRYNKTL